MGTCLWNLNSKSYWHCPHHQRQLLTSTPWTEFAGWPQSLILNLQWLFWIYLFFFASIQFWWFSLSSISCHHRLQWYIWHIWAPILHCVAFRHFPDLTFKQLCLDPSFAFLHTLSPRDTIFTKHQALAPSSPMLLQSNPRWVRLEFCCKASARACQETHHMTWEVRWSTQHTRSVKLRNSFTFAFVFQIGQHHHLLSPTGKKTQLFWTPSFWTLGVWVPPKSISKLYSKMCSQWASKQNISTNFLQVYSVGSQFCWSQSWMFLHPKTWNLEVSQHYSPEGTARRSRAVAGAWGWFCLVN